MISALDSYKPCASSRSVALLVFFVGRQQMIHKIVVILLTNHLDHVVFRSIHDQDSKWIGFCSKAPFAKFVPSRATDDHSGYTGMNGILVVFHRQVECQIGPRRMPGQDPFLDSP